MPDDPKPTPIRDDLPPGGFHLRDAYEHFCDPKLWRQYEMARAAAPRGRFVISPGVDADQDAVCLAARNRGLKAKLQRCWKALNADFWDRVKTGGIVGIGHLDSPNQPKQKIPPDEWQWLLTRGKDGATFKGEGRCWYRVEFHWAALAPTAMSETGATARTEAVPLRKRTGRPLLETEHARDVMRACVEADEIDFTKPQARAIEIVKCRCDVSPETARKVVKPYFDTWRAIAAHVKAGEIDPAEAGPATAATVRSHLTHLVDDPRKAILNDEIILKMVARFATRRP